MSVKPILFNTEMVQAILDGRKTVTRRVIKPQPIYNEHEGFEWRGGAYGLSLPPTLDGAAYNFRCACPYQPGDILYVRETWQYVYDMDDFDQIIEETGRYVYCADNPMPFSYWVDSTTGGHKDYMPWRPSIHMPKEAARIWLKVTDVWLERLQDITKEQAGKEGVSYATDNSGLMRIAQFIKLWNSTLKGSNLEKYG